MEYTAAHILNSVHELEICDDEDEMDKLLPGVFLGNVIDSNDLDQLNKRRVSKFKKILTCFHSCAHVQIQRGKVFN